MSRKKTAAVFAAAVAVIIAVISVIYVNYDKSTEKVRVDLYFINRDGTGIVSEPCDIRYKNEEDLVSSTLEKLRRGPSSRGLGAVMPKDTGVTSIVLEGGGYLTVDFSEKFLTDDASRNVLNTYAVVKTLSTAAYVSSVKVLVNGKSVEDRDGKPLEYITASDINLETEEYRREMREVILYFADKANEKLKGEVRTIKITDQQPIEQYIINELIKGTKEKGMHSVLSDKSVLMSVDVEDNICYLNFKSEFLSDNTGNEKHERLVICSIVNSLTELPNISMVQFYMDGKRVEKFGHIDIKNHIERDETIINNEGEE